MKIQDMNIGEFSAFICTYLKNHGVNCVLSGGACVSIYSNNIYQSGDLDFIETGYSQRTRIKEILSEIGFEEFNRYFKHKDTEFFVEFPSGPLSIGSERVKEISELKFETGILKLLSPTDCVKDRLSAYFFWNDKQSLEQAIWVSKSQKIDIVEVERWSIVENCLDLFTKIKELFV